jgi:hypothetical protein
MALASARLLFAVAKRNAGSPLMASRRKQNAQFSTLKGFSGEFVPVSLYVTA